MAAAQAMLRAASAVVLAAASLAGGRSSIEHHDATLAQHDMTSRRLQNTIAGTMVSGLSAERGWCLDSVTFHYADGGTTMFGESGGGPVPRVDLNPTAEYVSGVLQYGATVGCRQYMEGGIEFIVKSIATGATTRTVSFAGSYQSSTVLREYNVEWPCRILGLEFDSRYIDGVQTDCTSAAEVRHDGESFSYVSCVDGAIIWNDRSYTISSVPDVLRGARLYQGPVRLAYNEALEISMPEGGRAFAAFTANRDGGMPAGLRDDGWVDVAPQGLHWDGMEGQPNYIEPLLSKSFAPGETYTSPRNQGTDAAVDSSLGLDTVMFVVLDPEPSTTAGTSFTFQAGRCYPQSEAPVINTAGLMSSTLRRTGTPQECYDYCTDNSGFNIMGLDLRPTGGQDCQCNHPSVKSRKRGETKSRFARRQSRRGRLQRWSGL